jgi:hypothetical protein
LHILILRLVIICIIPHLLSPIPTFIDIILSIPSRAFDRLRHWGCRSLRIWANEVDSTLYMGVHQSVVETTVAFKHSNIQTVHHYVDRVKVRRPSL